MNDLEARLGRLERRAKTCQWTTITLVVAVLTLGFGPAQQVNRVEARRFVATDAQGAERLRLDEQGVHLFDTTGGMRASLALAVSPIGEAPGLAFFGPQPEGGGALSRILLRFEPEGGVSMGLSAPEAGSIRFSLSEGGHPQATILGQGGRVLWEVP